MMIYFSIYLSNWLIITVLFVFVYCIFLTIFSLNYNNPTFSFHIYFYFPVSYLGCSYPFHIQQYKKFFYITLSFFFLFTSFFLKKKTERTRKLFHYFQRVARDARYLVYSRICWSKNSVLCFHKRNIWRLKSLSQSVSSFCLWFSCLRVFLLCKKQYGVGCYYLLQFLFSFQVKDRKNVSKQLFKSRTKIKFQL